MILQLLTVGVLFALCIAQFGFRPAHPLVEGLLGLGRTPAAFCHVALPPSLNNECGRDGRRIFLEQAYGSAVTVPFKPQLGWCGLRKVTILRIALDSRGITSFLRHVISHVDILHLVTCIISGLIIRRFLQGRPAVGCTDGWRYGRSRGRRPSCMRAIGRRASGALNICGITIRNRSTCSPLPLRQRGQAGTWDPHRWARSFHWRTTMISRLVPSAAKHRPGAVGPDRPQVCGGGRRLRHRATTPGATTLRRCACHCGRAGRAARKTGRRPGEAGKRSALPAGPIPWAGAGTRATIGTPSSSSTSSVAIPRTTCLPLAPSRTARSPSACAVQTTDQLLELVETRQERGIRTCRPAAASEAHWHRGRRNPLGALRGMVSS